MDDGASPAPPSTLVISGGGTVRVSTDALMGQAAALDLVSAELESAGRRLLAIDRAAPVSLLVAADAPLSAFRAETAIDEASEEVTRAAQAAALLASGLRSGADAYGAAEQAVSAIARDVAAKVANGIGLLAGSFGMLALGASAPLLLGGVAGLAIAGTARPDALRTVAEALARGLGRSRGALSSPLVVSLTRLAVMSADDLGTGLLRVPPALAGLLGDEGLGILGLATSASVVAATAAPFGALTETPVSIQVVRREQAPAATGFADRASRIPSSPSKQDAEPTVPTIGSPPAQAPNPAPQIRIDRVSEPGRPDTFEVYLGGTVDFGAVASDEPFDLTSNVGGLAGSDAAGSYRAVEQALADSGATAESSITVTGYSQGGLVGAMLAASDDHTVTGLFTLGAPAAQVPVPASVPWVAVEHSDDLVPALGGTWTSTDPVVVQREVVTAGAPESGLFFPAHELAQYRASAAMLDDAADPRVGQVLEALGAGSASRSTAGSAPTVTSTWYEASREAPR